MVAPLRVALIGCGGIGQTHARALENSNEARCSAVFDLDRGRAERLRSTLAPDAEILEDVVQVAASAEAAIVAVPNAQHAPLTIQLLEAGVHVLCEKPLALSAADAETMLTAARAANRVLSCGLVRRFYGSTELVLQILRRGLLGEPICFQIRESVTSWALTHASFDRAISGGGVFVDMAPHVLDLLTHWFGPCEILEYRDDSSGGVEASSIAHVRSGGIEGTIHLTRAYATVNRTRIICRNGLIDVDPHAYDRVNVEFSREAPFVTAMTVEPRDPFSTQLNAFVAAVRARSRDGTVSDHVHATESAYARRLVLPEPWSGPFAGGRGAKNPGVERWNRILVTGATGSIGSRLVERWAEAGRLVQLRCLVRGYRAASRLCRFDANIACADLLSRKDLLAAARGCDAVVHLAYGEQAQAETETLVAVCQELGIRRLVHMSSAAVYGRRLPRTLESAQERTPVERTGEPYADAKAAAEAVVLAARDLDAHVLRPHMVYGPGLRWSGGLMQLLPTGRVPIVEDGGIINLIHVDDLVDAIACALATDAGFGEGIFITDGTPRPWSDYILKHAALLGVTPQHVRSEDVAEQRRTMHQWFADSLRPLAAVARSAEFRNFVLTSPLMQATVLRTYSRFRKMKRLQPWLTRLRSQPSSSSASPPYDQTWIQMQLSEARLSSDSAASKIGFRAAISFDEGMRRTSAWFAAFGMMPGEP